MAAAIIRLRSKPERLAAEQAAELRQALLPLEPAMPDAVRSLISYIDRHTASTNRWAFVMISPAMNRAVVHHLRRTSDRPLVAMECWALCLEHLRADTGEITLTRDQLAEALGERPNNVSQIMGVLVGFGAVSRRRVRVAGMRGPGAARYFLNPAIATHLSGAERDAAQAQAPGLRLVEPTPAKRPNAGRSGHPAA